MTGVAFSPNEAKEYGKIFPDITNLGSLNSAKIDSLASSFERNDKSVMSLAIGGDNYDKIFGTSARTLLPSEANRQDMESVKQQPIGAVFEFNGHQVRKNGENDYEIINNQSSIPTTTAPPPTPKRSGLFNLGSFFK
jgi:hypothetical protein